MQDLIYKYYKKFIINKKEIIIFLNNWKNNSYLELVNEYIFYILLDIKNIKNNIYKLKIFYFNLSIWKHCLILYFFFTGIIPFFFVILFWIFFIFFIFNNILLFIDIFFFKFLLIISNNNKYIIKIYYYFTKFYKILVFFSEIFYKILIYFIILILNFITLKWWKNKIYLVIINPIDKFLCKFLDIFLSFFPVIWKSIKFLFFKIFINIIILKDNWIIIYRPKFRKLIIKIKTLRFFKINWIYYFGIYIKNFLLIKNFLYTIFNKWFWLYFFQIYFFDMFLLKNKNIFLFLFFNFYYKINYYYYIIFFKIKTLYYYFFFYILNLWKKIIYKIIFILYIIFFKIKIYIFYFNSIIIKKLFFYYNWIKITWWFFSVFKLLLLFDIKYKNYIQLRLTYFNDINFNIISQIKLYNIISQIKLYNIIYIYIILYLKLNFFCFIIYLIYKL